MGWFKVAAVTTGLLIAFLVVSSVIGLLIEAVIAALVVVTVILGIKAAVSNRQISSKMFDEEARKPRTKRPLHHRDTSSVDDELARLKREMDDE